MVVTFIFAFLAVLALIALAAWLVRRFAGNRLGANTNRGRMPRLAVIDAAAVDGRRRLVLVRRDNIEHLLMIGGPSDIVVESNIVRASPAREQLPQRPGMAQPGVPVAEPPRVAPLPDTAWNESEAARADAFDHHEPPLMSEPPPRQTRPSFAEELRRPVPQSADRRGEPLAGFAPDSLGGRPERTEPRPEPRPEPRLEPRAEPRSEPMLPRMPVRSEPMMPQRPVRPAAEAPKPPQPRPSQSERAASAPPPPQPPAPPAPTPAQSADQNLAEMAQRLEAALRRPASSAPADTAPPVAPEPPPVRERAAAPPRNEPPPAAPPPPPAATPKSSFENLEDEMASLLGRPKSSSS
jgi:flagellar protein FliO/FliZ